MARISNPWLEFASCEVILWPVRNAKRTVSLLKDKIMMMMQVTDQMWGSKCNSKGVTQIISKPDTFLQTLGLEVVLWWFHYPHTLLSADTEWRHTNVRQHPKQCLQTHGAVCWKTADRRLAAGRDEVHMAEFSWKGWHRSKGCQKALTVSWT